MKRKPGVHRDLWQKLLHSVLNTAKLRLEMLQTLSNHSVNVHIRCPLYFSSLASDTACQCCKLFLLHIFSYRAYYTYCCILYCNLYISMRIQYIFGLLRHIHYSRRSLAQRTCHAANYLLYQRKFYFATKGRSLSKDQRNLHLVPNW